jgi:hypothetical protein
LRQLQQWLQRGLPRSRVVGEAESVYNKQAVKQQQLAALAAAMPCRLVQNPTSICWMLFQCHMSRQHCQQLTVMQQTVAGSVRTLCWACADKALGSSCNMLTQHVDEGSPAAAGAGHVQSWSNHCRHRQQQEQHCTAAEQCDSACRTAGAAA